MTIDEMGALPEDPAKINLDDRAPRSLLVFDLRARLPIRSPDLIGFGIPQA
jgi:hypothetical protein